MLLNKELSEADDGDIEVMRLWCCLFSVYMKLLTSDNCIYASKLK